MVLRLKSLRQLGKHARIASAKKVPGRRLPRGPSVPQAQLWSLVKRTYPDAETEVSGLVPGRRYVVDMVLREYGLAIEIDGWEYHGKYKKGFIRDRQKDRALLLAGWRVVRFTAGEILKDPETVMTTLAKVVRMIERERRDQWQNEQ
jgi:very-short-patch-repair endonuclease